MVSDCAYRENITLTVSKLLITFTKNKIKNFSKTCSNFDLNFQIYTCLHAGLVYV